MGKNYINYHCHSHYSNVSTPDVVIKNKDRVDRAVALGQGVVSGVEHGTLGNYFELMELAKSNKVKPLFGTEAYFVIDRFEKDSTNAHIILLAKNENGRKAINRVISEANVTGFYFKARTDLSLLLSLPSDDVWVTTACVGGIWKYEDKAIEIFERLFNHFGKNMFLEVQYHNKDSQKKLNAKIIDMSYEYGCQIIAGMDTHMIDMKDSYIRDEYLASRGISYPDEIGWFLDYPDYDTAFARFVDQGILTKDEIEVALDNTNIFLSVEEYNSIIFDKNKIKLPSIYPDKTQDEKNKILEKIIWDKWSFEKANVDSSRWPEYESEIKKELDTILETGIADYFLLDYEIIKRGVEKGGMITLTSRGSAPSFYLSKLLGFTTIDRISSPIKLYPARFISKERLLKTRSLPDIDMNLGNPEDIEMAQEEVLGKGHSYRMLSYQKVGEANAWKLYARYKEIDFAVANIVSDQIRQYEEDLKYAESEEDKELINIQDYIDEKYWDMFEKSKVYLQLIYALTQHPCGFLLFDNGLIEEEIGLIRTKDVICAAIDGKSAEKYLFLKNDLLKVSVVEIIYNTYKRVGIKPDNFSDLIEKTKNDELVWDIYKNGVTMAINQFETPKTTEKAKRYSPKNISELSAMVAAIRPGFKSLYSRYEKREPFSYGVKALDRIIQTKEFPYSYMLYQENAMGVMEFASIPIHETHDIIKAIAKKRYNDVFKWKEIFISSMYNKLINDEHEPKEVAEKISHDIWKVIEDSSNYSFNASHSLSVAGDGLYGAYLKAHYPVAFYETILRTYEKDGKKDKIILAKIEAQKFFGINFPNFKFGDDNTSIKGNEETNTITMSLKTLKGFGESVAENMVQLYSEYKKSGKDFVDLMMIAEELGFLNKTFYNLIKIDYFSDFGNQTKLLEFYSEFVEGKFRYRRTLSENTKIKRINELRDIWNWFPPRNFSIFEKINNEVSVIGYPYSSYDVSSRYCFVKEINNKGWNPQLKIIQISNGIERDVKIERDIFESHIIKEGDIILAKSIDKKYKKTKDENGKWKTTDNFDIFISTYYIMTENDEFLQ